MKIKETIGIDVSKLTFDVAIYSNQKHDVFENSTKGFEQMISWVKKNSTFSEEEMFYIFEHTGLYSYQLSVFLTSKKIPFALVPGLAIKRSLGIARGKSDQVDAAKIAQYGYRLKEEIKPYRMPSVSINTLKRLLSLRERFVKQRAGYKASLKEQKRVLIKNENEKLFETQERMVKYLSKQIETIEKEMKGIINQEEHLKEIYDLLITIKGIGKQISLFMIVYTDAFTKFENHRKFASYCGIAPFPNSSGTSLRGRTKVSHLANKKIKTLLDLCAKSAIQFNPEMKKYYTQRVENGKNKMSTINIVRNKLLARMFAVINRKTPYVDVLKYAA